MRCVIFTGGKLEDSLLVRSAITKADAIFAADSGAEKALSYNVVPEVVVGDFDSLPKKTWKVLQKKGSKIISFKQEKNETDTELALQLAIKKGATEITLLGGVFGSRLDHILANVFLGLFYKKVQMTFVSGKTTAQIIHGPTKITLSGKKADVVSLLPLVGNAEGIDLQGLYYPLKNGTLVLGKPKGMSNVFTAKEASISVKKGALLIVQTNKKK